jgi:hypothetical protein
MEFTLRRSGKAFARCHGAARDLERDHGKFRFAEDEKAWTRGGLIRTLRGFVSTISLQSRIEADRQFPGICIEEDHCA